MPLKNWGPLLLIAAALPVPAMAADRANASAAAPLAGLGLAYHPVARP